MLLLITDMPYDTIEDVLPGKPRRPPCTLSAGGLVHQLRYGRSVPSILVVDARLKEAGIEWSRQKVKTLLVLGNALCH
jgi:hypothetical protein